MIELQIMPAPIPGYTPEGDPRYYDMVLHQPLHQQHQQRQQQHQIHHSNSSTLRRNASMKVCVADYDISRVLLNTEEEREKSSLFNIRTRALPRNAAHAHTAKVT